MRLHAGFHRLRQRLCESRLEHRQLRRVRRRLRYVSGLPERPLRGHRRLRHGVRGSADRVRLRHLRRSLQRRPLLRRVRDVLPAGGRLQRGGPASRRRPACPAARFASTVRIRPAAAALASSGCWATPTPATEAPVEGETAACAATTNETFYTFRATALIAQHVGSSMEWKPPGERLRTGRARCWFTTCPACSGALLSHCCPGSSQRRLSPHRLEQRTLDTQRSAPSPPHASTRSGRNSCPLATFVLAAATFVSQAPTVASGQARKAGSHQEILPLRVLV